MSVAPPGHLSPSAWAKWDVCPRQWADHYVYGHDEPATASMEVGTFAHSVLELLMERAPEDRTVEGAYGIAKWLWSMGPRGTLSIQRGEITEARFKSAAWYAIQGLWGVEEPAGVDVVATERRIEWKQGDVPMEVVVDRVDRLGRDSLTPGLLAIIDYKSGKVPKPKFRDKHQRQIAVGALGVIAETGQPLEMAQGGALLYVSADKALAAPTDRETLRAVHRAAQETWGDILAACETEDFPATAGPLCSWCTLAAECPEGRARVSRALSSGWVTGEEPGAKLVAAAERA